jgi:hypothetical protein
MEVWPDISTPSAVGLAGEAPATDRRLVAIEWLHLECEQ